MKICTGLLPLCLAVCPMFGTTAWAGTDCNNTRKYIDPNCVSMKKGKIVIKTKSGPKIAKSLHSNKKGLYVLKGDLQNAVTKNPDVQGPFECSQCDYSSFSETCRDSHEASRHSDASSSSESKK
jgi:hypothetical protein